VNESSWPVILHAGACRRRKPTRPSPPHRLRTDHGSCQDGADAGEASSAPPRPCRSANLQHIAAAAPGSCSSSAACHRVGTAYRRFPSKGAIALQQNRQLGSSPSPTFWFPRLHRLPAARQSSSFHFLSGRLHRHLLSSLQARVRPVPGLSHADLSGLVERFVMLIGQPDVRLSRNRRG